ncbi:MAG: glycosyltransferase family 39 protein [Anaerolineales bacterium]|nr:glycosyltransferase family 39 protein [Anaerolineales bacterium]
MILLLALGLRLWGLDNGLPHGQVTDESSGISASLRIASGAPPDYAYIRAGWDIMQWSALGPYYAALKLTNPGFSTADFEALYFTHREYFILVVRIMTVFLTLAGVFLAYLTGRELTGNDGGGLLAGLFMGVQPFAAYLAHYSLSDNMGLLGVTITLTASVYMARRGTRWSYILGGIGLTIAMLGHLQTVVVGIALVLAHIIYWWRQPGRPISFLATHWLWALLAFVVSHLILNPYIILDTDAVLSDIGFIFSERFSTTNTLAERIENIKANALLPLIPMRPYLALLSLAGTALAILRRRLEPLVLAVFLILFSFSMMPAPGPRITFWLATAFPVAILGAYAIWTWSQYERRKQRWIAVSVGSIALVLALGECLLIDSAMAAPNTRSAAYEYIIQHIPENSRILIGEPFTFSVPLARNATSIQRMQTLTTLPPSYAYRLSHPDLFHQPEYDLFGAEFQSQITDHATWWNFVRANDIEYVIENDYCQGSSRYGVDSVIEFPVIDDQTRTELQLVQVFSPFRSESCEQSIENRTPMEKMDLLGWIRVGPVIRLYRVPAA